MGEEAEDPAAVLARLRDELTGPGSRFEVVDEVVRGHRMPVFRHRARSLREMLEATARFGDRTFLVQGDVRLTFAAHRGAVDSLTVHLQERYGVRAGDRVGLFAANRWEWIVAFWAIASTGAIPCAYNGWWTADEAAAATALVEPVMVIGDRERLTRLTGGAAVLPQLDLDAVAGLARRQDGRTPVLAPTDEDSTALLLFTSGTTGRPKAVMVTHRSIIGFVQINVFDEALSRRAAGAPLLRPGQPLPPSEAVVLITSPLFHTSMLQGMVMMAIERGNALVLLPGRFDPEAVLRTIEAEKVTMWSALGSAAPRICACEALGRYDTSSLDRLAIGGAPVSPAVQERLRSAFPTAARSIGMGYTSTEGGAVIARIGGPEYVANPTSTGRPTVTTRVALLDSAGLPVAEGAEGEIHVRSPYVMLGYWNDPEACRAVLKDDGWLAMGDIGRIENGLLYINSRARDLILVSAENVSPTEVEYCLEEHPAVAEAAVFAIDDDRTGDAVCAVVHLRPGATAGPDELATWSRARLARYKVPTSWHVSGEPLPRTASGKLLKSILRDRLAPDLPVERA